MMQSIGKKQETTNSYDKHPQDQEKVEKGDIEVARRLF